MYTMRNKKNVNLFALEHSTLIIVLNSVKIVRRNVINVLMLISVFNAIMGFIFMAECVLHVLMIAKCVVIIIVANNAWIRKFIARFIINVF